MPNKKADDGKLPPEEQALEQHVKAIMEGPEPSAEQPIAADPDPLPLLDVFHDPQTAPTVSAKLLKKIGVDTPPGDNQTQPSTPSPSALSTSSTAPEAAAVASPTTQAELTASADITADGTESTAALTGSDATAEVPGDETVPGGKQSTVLDDSYTEKAVDDIVVNESDAVLAAEDAASQQTTSGKTSKQRPRGNFKRFLANKWLWLALIVAVGGLFGYPLTRYKLLGLVLKESVSVSVTDSKTATPVSNATVSLAGKSAKTDASGTAFLRVPPGQTTLRITKQYYKLYSGPQAVGLKSGKHLSVRLYATGRQVPVTVLNRITGQPLAGAELSVLDTTAKTNQQGQATIVLPTTAASDTASVVLDGYNTAHVSIQVTSSVVPGNTINLTPAGHVYFLSNLSGTIDVVKTNLDGSGRQTVFAGTGKEDPNTTSLLASRDWRYVVLKAQRDGSSPALYLINTSTDKVTQFDGGNADFTLLGWYGHYFMYDVVRNNVPSWQSGHESIKSYNADSGQLGLLDQNQAEGTSTDYAYQGFYNFYILNDLLVYDTQWYTYNTGGSYDLGSKTDTIRAVQPAGQGKKDYQSLPASGLGYVQAVLFEPQSVYYAVYSYNTNAAAYYKFENAAVTAVSNLSQTTFNQTYPTYLVSPSGNQTFWTELRDGQNTLFVGDQTGATKQQVASLSDYAPYGWYTDSYVLVSKTNSQLYIMPAGDLKTGQQPLKITDYYKPTQTYNGYGYGYGGL